MAQRLRQAFPASQPNPALTKIWNDYPGIFLHDPLPLLGVNYPLSFDYKSILVEVPPEKLGVYNKEHHPHWNRGNQGQRQGGLKRSEFRPFQQSGLCEDSNKKAWYYQDAQKKNLGPFTSKEMDGFIYKGVIDQNTRVAFETLEKFVKIEKIIKIAQSQITQTIPQSQNQHHIKDPFQKSGFTTDSESKLWYYKTTTSQEGPLSTKEIDLLWETNQINESTKIAFETTQKFVKLEQIIKVAEKNIAVEVEAKKKAEKELKEREEAERKKLEEEEAKLRKQEEEARKKLELEEQARQKAREAEEARLEKEEEDRKKAFAAKFGIPLQQLLSPEGPKVNIVIAPQTVQRTKGGKRPIEGRERAANKSWHVDATIPPKLLNEKSGPYAPKQQPKLEVINEPQFAEIKQEQKKEETKKQELQQPQIKIVVKEPQQQKVQEPPPKVNEDDEWISVSSQAQIKKKPKQQQQDISQIPGLQLKVQPKQQQIQVQKQQVTKQIETKQESKLEEDEWIEVDIKKPITKKK